MYVIKTFMKFVNVLNVRAPFRAKEVDSFLSRAKDMETGRIYYEDYIAMMTQELEAMDL